MFFLMDSVWGQCEQWWWPEAHGQTALWGEMVDTEEAEFENTKKHLQSVPVSSYHHDHSAFSVKIFLLKTWLNAR